MTVFNAQSYLDQLSQLAAEARRQEALHATEARGATRAAEAYEEAARRLLEQLQTPATDEEPLEFPRSEVLPVQE